MSSNLSKTAPVSTPKDIEATFASLALLDTRILRALADQSFVKPTLVQAKAIPLALEGRDILCRARTGSGKTVAYCVPVLERVLTGRKAAKTDVERQCTRVAILVPTRELAEQVTNQIKKLAKYCESLIITNVAGGASTHLYRVALDDKPDVVIGTPARVLALVQAKTLDLQTLEMLVIDEADLILSYGHAQTMQTLLSSHHSNPTAETSAEQPSNTISASKAIKGSTAYLPSVFQSLLMSATLTEDVTTLKSLVLRNPAILTLTEQESKDSDNLLSQYVLHLASEMEKFLHIYVILKLKLVQGKAILFVNDVERCFRLKLFLEQFSIRCCVLNKELPINSRYHTIQEFNKGVYDYIIATDESSGRDEEVDSESEENGDEAEEQVDDGAIEEPGQAAAQGGEAPPTNKKRKREVTDVDGDHLMDPTDNAELVTKKQKNESQSQGKRKEKKASRGTEKEYSTSRGVDFIDVACVINFDLPLSHRSYVHRVGRTARAGRAGVAISMVVTPDEAGHRKSSRHKTQVNEAKLWRRIEREQNGWTKEVMSAPSESRPESVIKPFNIAPSLLSGFKYRMQDALRSVTGKAIKEARIKELKTEILNSDKLKAHFEDHPLDLEYLRHDKPLHPSRVQTHMKFVPSYLLPRGALSTAKSISREGDATVSTSTAPELSCISLEANLDPYHHQMYQDDLDDLLPRLPNRQPALPRFNSDSEDPFSNPFSSGSDPWASYGGQAGGFDDWNANAFAETPSQTQPFEQIDKSPTSPDVLRDPHKLTEDVVADEATYTASDQPAPMEQPTHLQSAPEEPSAVVDPLDAALSNVQEEPEHIPVFKRKLPLVTKELDEPPAAAEALPVTPSSPEESVKTESEKGATVVDTKTPAERSMTEETIAAPRDTPTVPVAPKSIDPSTPATPSNMLDIPPPTNPEPIPSSPRPPSVDTQVTPSHILSRDPSTSDAEGKSSLDKVAISPLERTPSSVPNPLDRNFT
ncbi:ATP-dependent DNA/RNA helicase, partial [Serendipita sp. 399]